MTPVWDLNRWFSRKCCGGPVLAMFAMCVGIGGILLYFEAFAPALVFITAGFATQGLCLIMGRSRCRQGYDGQHFAG